ncbi:Cyanovirin-N [Aspergillus aurantiobrunneus]
MSFHLSCQDIRIEVRDGYTVLLAGAGIGDDEYVPAEIDLDEQIGNDDGFFTRDGANFTDTAEDIQLEFRDDGPWLTAYLLKANGEDREHQGINLAEHIGNEDGELVFV